METKICTKCKNEFPASKDYFNAQKNGKYGLRSVCKKCCKKYYSNRHRENYKKEHGHYYVKEIKKTKTCSRCGNEFPLNDTYFFKKVIKQELANGEIAVYYGYRHLCKKCHAAVTLEKKRKKRYKELGCTESGYKAAYIEQQRFKKIKFKELANVDDKTRAKILRVFRKYGKMFYSEEDYDQHLIEVRKQASLKHRKYDYGNADFITPKMSSEKYMLNLTNARMAQSLGMSVKDVPEEIIETKRLTIKLKRELGLTHSSIKERNIKN